MKSLGPADAAELLLEQYGDELYRFIRYTIGRKPESDDIFQETFVRALQSWGNFRQRSSAKTWLWSIAKNCIRDFYRSQKRASKNVVLCDDMPSRHPAVDDLMNVRLAESLQNVTVEQRQVFIERFINDKSTADTAQILGWSESKVKTTLHRAMKELRKTFKEGADISD